MRLNRRDALKLISAASSTLALRPSAFAQQDTVAGLTHTPGPYQPTRASLANYRIPAWFADAKFGIWSHWGPQSGVEDGDWYARNMYIQDSAQYKYHVATYGHPSKIGYKDLVPQFKGARWDPDHLMDLYSKAGAKYFFSMGVHHDNFDMWNSKYQPRWNAVATGPKRDIVGLYAAAARKRNLRFGVSEHLSNSYCWLAPSHTADSTGPLAGVPYDGTDPAYSDLYHDFTGQPADFARATKAMSRIAPDRWKLQYFRRIQDLLDQHHPDMLYTDGGIPFDETGLSLIANLYNASAAKNNGVAQTVYNSKTAADCAIGTCALDRERGVLDAISVNPWQTDTCVGQWHYKKGGSYKSAKKVVDLLVDIVSKNGNLLLNFPLPNSGELDPEELTTLAGITSWMDVNGEGIFASRPWKINGEGPATQVHVGSGNFNEDKKPDMAAADIRFTTKGPHTLYAFLQGWPDATATINALGSASPQSPAKVTRAQLLGHSENLKFTQSPTALLVTLPTTKPPTADLGITLKLTTT